MTDDGVHRGPSVLFDGAAPPERHRGSPFVTDLNLDQVFSAMSAGREEYDLTPFCHMPLDDLDAIAYRHEVFRELEDDGLRTQIDAFAGALRRMRASLKQAEELRHEHQKSWWLLDAAASYVRAVTAFARALARHDLRSRALLAVRDHVVTYASSERFRALAGDVARRQDELSSVGYQVLIQGNRVTVDRAAPLPDYRSEVEATFEKFRQGEVEDTRLAFRERAEVDTVEARILDRVALLHPGVFTALAGFCVRHRDYLDPVVARFDREIQLYLGYLALIEPLRATGLSFAYPRLSTESKAIDARDTFDLALAHRRAGQGASVVVNDLALSGAERIIVVSGPNQGGKTTFARTFGQLHYLARLGLPVPGSDVRLYLCDRVFTHFEREERLEDLRGKLQDDLVRVHAILDQATAASVVVLNESFASTTLSDALFLGRALIGRLIERDLLAVYVTFIDDLSRLGEATVSMVSTVVPEDPTRRTFKILRRPADGRAYALAIAEQYGLTYETLRRRFAR